MTKKLNIIRSDDWMIVYVDGKMWRQDDSIPVDEILDAAGVPYSYDWYEYKEEPGNKLADIGFFPDTYEEFEKDWRHDGYNEHYESRQ